jgi:hypothetical protein
VAESFLIVSKKPSNETIELENGYMTIELVNLKSKIILYLDGEIKWKDTVTPVKDFDSESGTLAADDDIFGKEVDNNYSKKEEEKDDDDSSEDDISDEQRRPAKVAKLPPKKQLSVPKQQPVQQIQYGT